MKVFDTVDNAEVHILNHEKCGKCNNIFYEGKCFFCYDGKIPIELPKYVTTNFKCLANFSKRTKTSVVVNLDSNKEFDYIVKY